LRGHNTYLYGGPYRFKHMNIKDENQTGGVRPARRHTFVRQQKYAKVPAPCGGHLLCLISEASTNDTALEAGPLQGGLPFSVTYGGKA